MPTDVVMPQLGESIFEGTITKWLKQPGEAIEKDEPLFEISTDKVDAEIPAPVSGTLSEIRAAEGETVEVNTVVAVIAEGAAAKPSDESGEAAARHRTGRQAGHRSEAANCRAETPEPEAPPRPKANSGSTEVVMPQLGESIFEGTITQWFKKAGDAVAKDEPLFEVSTDKVDAEIPAPVSGILREICVSAGETVQVHTVVAVIGGSEAVAQPDGEPANGAAEQRGTGNRSSGHRAAFAGIDDRRLQWTPRRNPGLQSLCAARPWCGASLGRTIWICAAFAGPAPTGASPRKMSCALWRKEQHSRPRSASPPRRLRGGGRPLRNRLQAGLSPCRACAPSLRSACWRAARPSPTPTWCTGWT